MSLPKLKFRKIFYLLLAVPSALVWFPIASMGLAVVVGALGLAGIVGLRSIVLLPIREEKVRRIYNALLMLGIAPMAIIAPALSGACPTVGAKERLFCVLPLSGVALLFVGACLLWEINREGGASSA